MGALPARLYPSRLSKRVPAAGRTEWDSALCVGVLPVENWQQTRGVHGNEGCTRTLNQIQVQGIVASEEAQTHKNSSKGFTLVKILKGG